MVEDAVVDAAEAMTGFGEKNDIMERCRLAWPIKTHARFPSRKRVECIPGPRENPLQVVQRHLGRSCRRHIVEQAAKKMVRIATGHSTVVRVVYKDHELLERARKHKMNIKHSTDVATS